MSISYDNIAKSMVYFVKNSVSAIISAINASSPVARMNMPDPTSGKFQTPLCVVRQVSDDSRTFANSTDEYKFLDYSVIIMGDTFTIVSKLKDAISSSLRSTRRIPIYEWSYSDAPPVPLTPIAYALLQNGSGFALPDAEIPCREYDSLVFRIRVKVN